MAKYGEGLAKEIVKAVNNGEMKEPITIEKIKKLCNDKWGTFEIRTVYSQLRNSSLNKNYNSNNTSYFLQVNRGKYILLEKYRKLQFDKEIEKSKNDTREVRLERLKNVKNTKPEIYISETGKFKRNSDVVAEVLFRANGICEECNCEAPFKRKSDGTPYLEVHHKISLSDKGEDTVENCIAVCPNCHRKLHYGQ
ncbi:MAG: HNH endonuclease [Paeniclostridium sordellii]|nr:HNH endonuclease [Paeniclostridium sordellii]